MTLPPRKRRARRSKTMSEYRASAVSFTLLALALSWLVAFVLLHAWRIAKLRAQLMELRCGLIAALVGIQGDRDLQLAAQLRDWIREADQRAEAFSFTRLAVGMLVRRFRKGTPQAADRQAHADRPREGTPDDLLRIEQELTHLLSLHVLAGSPIGWAILAIAAIRSGWRSDLNAIRNRSVRMLPGQGNIQTLLRPEA
jgi:hypothetical protein